MARAIYGLALESLHGSIYAEDIQRVILTSRWEGEIRRIRVISSARLVPPLESQAFQNQRYRQEGSFSFEGDQTDTVEKGSAQQRKR